MQTAPALVPLLVTITFGLTACGPTLRAPLDQGHDYPAGPWSAAEYERWVEAAVAELEGKNAVLVRDFNLGSWEKWHMDQDAGELIFSAGGERRVVAKIFIAGSFASTSSTWMWSWNNASVVAHLKQPLERVRAFGKTHGIQPLVAPVSPASETEGWRLAAAACRVLDGRGVYSAPYGSGVVYLVITSLAHVD